MYSVLGGPEGVVVKRMCGMGRKGRERGRRETGQNKKNRVDSGTRLL